MTEVFGFHKIKAVKALTIGHLEGVDQSTATESIGLRLKMEAENVWHFLNTKSIYALN